MKARVFHIITIIRWWFHFSLFHFQQRFLAVLSNLFIRHEARVVATCCRRFWSGISHAAGSGQAIAGTARRFQCHCGCVTVLCVLNCFLKVSSNRQHLLTNLNASVALNMRDKFSIHSWFFSLYMFPLLFCFRFLHLIFIAHSARPGGVWHMHFMAFLLLSCFFQLRSSKLITHFIFNTHSPTASHWLT